MKILVTMFFALVLITSCEDSDTVQITASTSINESIIVNFPQTNGASVDYDQTTSEDITEIVSNFDTISSINIDSLSYQFKNVIGNTNAIIETASIIIQGNVIATISNINIATEASNSSVFEITDEVILNQLEANFLNNTSLTIQFSGTGISDEGDLDFEIEVSMQLTATF
ncbi:MAG: hypothetical protein HN487_05880 [Flavobacterium sp.]|nr:hypothetical protein [Flavobacterium sp.]